VGVDHDINVCPQLLFCFCFCLRYALTFVCNFMNRTDTLLPGDEGDGEVHERSGFLLVLCFSHWMRDVQDKMGKMEWMRSKQNCCAHLHK
jgi:hypothetical protein